MDPISTGAILGASGISAGANLASGLFRPSLSKQWRYQKKAMALQQQYALEQMQKQYDLERMKFDYTNEYNDPSAMLERYLKAGVNPSAVFGGSSIGAPASSSGSYGASGPSSGSFDFSSPAGNPNLNLASDMIMAQSANSTIERNDAAADRDRAEAEKLRGDTHTQDWRRRYDDLTLKLSENEVDVRKYQSDIARYQSYVAANESFISDATLMAQVDQVKAQTDILIQEANKLKAEAPFFSRMFEAQAASLETAAAYNRAMTRLAGEQATLTHQQYKDLANWFEANWETKQKVDIYDEKGRVVRSVEMTAGEMSAALQAFGIETAQQDRNLTHWQARSQKNELGYSILKTVLSAGASMATALLFKKVTKAPVPPTPTGYDEDRTNYNGNGEVIGGTTVHKRHVYSNKL